MLNDCNRLDDALAFLNRSKKLAEADDEEIFRKPYQRTKTRRQGSISRRHAATPPASLRETAEESPAGNDPDQVENKIQVDRTRVAAGDEDVKNSLKPIVDLGELHSDSRDPFPTSCVRSLKAYQQKQLTQLIHLELD